jgi:hypothetical protein
VDASVCKIAYPIHGPIVTRDAIDHAESVCFAVIEIIYVHCVSIFFVCGRIAKTPHRNGEMLGTLGTINFCAIHHFQELRWNLRD